MQVDFHHLTVTTLARTLPPMAAAMVAEGGRLLIVSADDGQRAELDRLLWTYRADSFLPHGQSGAGDDAAQPVLLAPGILAGNGARRVALVDGQWREEALRFDRALHFFGDQDIREARHAWRALADHEHVERRFWKQDEAGDWERAA